MLMLEGIGQASPRVKGLGSAPKIRNIIGVGAGGFLLTTGIAAILFSTDQRKLPQVARILRIILGAFMTVHFSLAIHTEAMEQEQ